MDQGWFIKGFLLDYKEISIEIESKFGNVYSSLIFMIFLLYFIKVLIIVDWKLKYLVFYYGQLEKFICYYWNSFLVFKFGFV